jgi:hypothetical protein
LSSSEGMASVRPLRRVGWKRCLSARQVAQKVSDVTVATGGHV